MAEEQSSLPTPRLRVGMGEDRPAGASIRDFLTDGSLPALCRELTRLLGVLVELREEHDKVVVFDDDDHTHPWRVQEQAEPSPKGASRIPLVIGGDPIGWIVVHPGTPGGPGAELSRGHVEQALRYLARAASELCTQELALWHRVQEVELMYRLSALLVRVGGAERVLNEALASALQVLELDAGSLVLLPEDAEGRVISGDEKDLVIKASRGLSREWLESTLPLSRERLFDPLSLSGEVVTSFDLASDPRVMHPQRTVAEGLRSFIGAGLVFQGRPIGVVRLYSRTPRQFSEADKRLLRSVAEQSAVAVEQARLLRVREDERQTQRQLQLAADVQRRMLPASDLKFEGIDAAARYIPSHRVGGDFYDAFSVGGAISLVVGDVVGNGIAAALLMASVRATLRAHAGLGLPVHEVVQRVNKALCIDTLESEFATLWYGLYDRGQRMLRYCSAGHEPPFVLRLNGSGEIDVVRLARGGLVVGIMPEEEYEAGEIALQPGDVLVAFTDGLAEASSFSGERFGVARIQRAAMEALREDREAGARQVIERIFWEQRQFVGLNAKMDDQTVVVVRVQ